MNFFTFFGTTWNGMKYWGGSYSRSHPLTIQYPSPLRRYAVRHRAICAVCR